MKHISILGCLWALAATAAVAQTPPASTKVLDERYGFRGVRFESDTSALPDRTLAEVGGTTRFYRRTGEVKQLGEGEVSSIRYGFYKGKLALVILETRGITNSRAILAAIQQQYGAGTRSSPFRQRYAWNGKAVTMSYDENAASNDATIFISSKKLRAQQLKAEYDAAKKLSPGQ
ncbi:hypothetical protein [Hymenobacter perfusus]|uniref:Uncharacterized protein n=1 Tax=Hymenobacter perfusus TaxID=1236770 RepID=A0A3R9MG15_9BACT|nr:hypothetical protein [Hymenobacter perfusus]RSK39564.1 hypothetical protein EI293_20310 [Hymenobacter perfusus]